MRRHKMFRQCTVGLVATLLVSLVAWNIARSQTTTTPNLGQLLQTLTGGATTPTQTATNPATTPTTTTQPSTPGGTASGTRQPIVTGNAQFQTATAAGLAARRPGTYIQNALAEHAGQLDSLDGSAVPEQLNFYRSTFDQVVLSAINAFSGVIQSLNGVLGLATGLGTTTGTGTTTTPTNSTTIPNQTTTGSGTTTQIE